MSEENIESIYEDHLENEPKRYGKFFPEINMGLETETHIKWKIEKEHLELVKSIPKEKRIEALNLLKKSKTCGEVARKLDIPNHMAVFYLIYYNLEDISILRSVSI